MYIYIYHVNLTQTVPDISPLMPMHQDPLLGVCVVRVYVSACNIIFADPDCPVVCNTYCWSPVLITDQIVTPQVSQYFTRLRRLVWKMPVRNIFKICNYQGNVEVMYSGFQSALCLLMAWHREVPGHLQAVWWTIYTVGKMVVTFRNFLQMEEDDDLLSVM